MTNVMPLRDTDPRRGACRPRLRSIRQQARPLSKKQFQLLQRLIAKCRVPR
jgi:hypothetical protein